MTLRDLDLWTRTRGATLRLRFDGMTWIVIVDCRPIPAVMTTHEELETAIRAAQDTTELMLAQSMTAHVAEA